jgi:hypothetical protein
MFHIRYNEFGKIEPCGGLQFSVEPQPDEDAVLVSEVRAIRVPEQGTMRPFLLAPEHADDSIDMLRLRQQIRLHEIEQRQSAPQFLQHPVAVRRRQAAPEGVYHRRGPGEAGKWRAPGLRQEEYQPWAWQLSDPVDPIHPEMVHPHARQGQPLLRTPGPRPRHVPHHQRHQRKRQLLRLQIQKLMCFGDQSFL